MQEPRNSLPQGLEATKKLSDFKSHYEQDAAKLLNDAILLGRSKATRSVLSQRRSHASALQRVVVNEKMKESTAAVRRRLRLPARSSPGGCSSTRHSPIKYE